MCFSGYWNGELKTQKKERAVGRGRERFTEEGVFELDVGGCIGIFCVTKFNVK